MERVFRIAALCVLVLGLAGCETPVQPRAFPEITFAHLPTIALDVARIDLVRRYRPPLTPPNVEHEAPVPPMQAGARWVTDRLKAVGRSGRATVTIRQASIVERRLPRLGGLKGVFTTEQSERYDAVIEMTIEASDGRGLRVASATARAERSRTVPEDATLARREEIWFELVEALMRDFDRTFEAQIRKHLAAFIK